MFETSAYITQQTVNLSSYGQLDKTTRANMVALQLYYFATFKALLGKIRSSLTKRGKSLLDLNEVEAHFILRSRHYAGIRIVGIQQIQGSEGRQGDFDRNFYPLQFHNKARWMNVAKAYLLEKTLPPVELIQIEDKYFVRDGHHRISVAKVLGQESIEAEVTVWEVGMSSVKQDATYARRTAAQSQ